MNPEELRQIVANAQRARAKNPNLTTADLDAYVRSETRGQHLSLAAAEKIAKFDTSISLPNLGRSAIMGGTYGWGDEMLGAVRGEAAGSEMSDAYEAFRSQHPMANFLSELAGGVAAPALAVGGGLAAGAGAAGAVGLGALTGALGAGVAGAGYAPEGQKLEGALDPLNLGVGAALGAAIPAVHASVRGHFSPSGAAASRLGTAVTESGGVASLVARAAEQEALGKTPTLGALSEPLAMQLDHAANTSPRARAAVLEAAQNNISEAPVRILNDARALLPGTPVLQKGLRDAKRGRAAWANGPEGYEGLRQANPVIDDMGEAALMTLEPSVAKEWAAAGEHVKMGLTPDLSLPPSFEKWHTLKQRLDDKIGTLYKAGAGGAATRLGEVRDRLVQMLRERVPGYEHVDNVYNAMRSSERAMQSGALAYQLEYPAVRDALDQLPRVSASVEAALRRAGVPTPLEAFRMGMASRLLAQLAKAEKSQAAMNRLMRSSPSLEKNLKLIFGSEEKFKEFMAKVAVEKTTASRLSGAVGNSHTAFRLAQQGQDAGAQLASAVAAGGPGAVLSVGQKLSRAVLSQKTAEAMTGPGLVQGAANIEQVLNALMARRPMRSPVMSAAVAPAMHATGGLLGRP